MTGNPAVLSGVIPAQAGIQMRQELL